MKTERELFELEARKYEGCDLSKNEDGSYKSDLTHTCFYWWCKSAQREGYVLTDKKKLAKVLNCVTDDWLIDTGAMDEFKEIESLVSDEIKTMIGASE